MMRKETLHVLFGISLIFAGIGLVAPEGGSAANSCLVVYFAISIVLLFATARRS
jgi:hypothetical protein